MDVKAIRQKKITELEARLGSLAAIERLTDGAVTASYLSQIKGGYRKMGDAIARRLERALRKDLGWMDHADVNHLTAQEPLTIQPVLANERQQGIEEARKFSIPVLDIEGGMGSGRAQPEYESVVGALDVSPAWVQGHLPKASSPANLRIITGYGDSMSGTYEDGDVLFVDTGYTEIRLDAVYVFELNRELFIKRLQRHPDGTLTAHSDNKRYDPIRIDRKDAVRVIGRVIGAWNWRRL